MGQVGLITHTCVCVCVYVHINTYMSVYVINLHVNYNAQSNISNEDIALDLHKSSHAE